MFVSRKRKSLPSPMFEGTRFLALWSLFHERGDTTFVWVLVDKASGKINADVTGHSDFWVISERLNCLDFTTVSEPAVSLFGLFSDFWHSHVIKGSENHWCLNLSVVCRIDDVLDELSKESESDHCPERFAVKIGAELTRDNLSDT